MPKTKTVKKGMLVIISAPGGGGKTSSIRALLEMLPNSINLVTTTSRTPRPEDIPGTTYHFVSKKTFEKKIASGDFLEYNLLADNYYGTQLRHLFPLLKKYDVVLWQLDVNGKKNLEKQKIPHLAIFLLPDKLANLEKRILKRGGMTKDMARKRMVIAKGEIARSKNYQYRVINKEGRLSETIEKMAKIIETELKTWPNLDKKPKIK
ncbi:MAG TPA: guanylate kinase [Patescibacteria group bacterium]|nr:guanylate kinase [Patescibacteria group bacterium]